MASDSWTKGKRDGWPYEWSDLSASEATSEDEAAGKGSCYSCIMCALYTLVSGDRRIFSLSPPRLLQDDFKRFSSKRHLTR